MGKQKPAQGIPCIDFVALAPFSQGFVLLRAEPILGSLFIILAATFLADIFFEEMFIELFTCLETAVASHTMMRLGIWRMKELDVTPGTTHE